MSTITDLHAHVPSPPVHVVSLGFRGPYQVQAQRVIIGTFPRKECAEYVAALWNLMPKVEGGEADTVEPSTANDRTTPPPVRRAGARQRRKAGRTAQVVP